MLDLAANTDQLGQLIKEKIAPELAEYGVETPSLMVENVSLPEAVEQALDKRTSMGVIGNLDAYQKFQTAEAISAAATTPGSAMGEAMGMGMGLAAGHTMGGAMGQGMQPGYGAQPQAPAPAPSHAAPPPPPPPPVERVWHIAENGATTGPFSRADLGRMAQQGTFKRETVVWSEGYPGWVKAEEAPELAQLFTVMPPPPPPPAG